MATDQARREKNIYLFVNPRSGDKRGEELVKLGISQLHFKSVPDCIVHIHDLLDDADRCTGYKHIRELIHGRTDGDDEPIHVVVGGGDGTLRTVLEQLEGTDIPLDAILFTLIPFGTGNDLARFLGSWHRLKSYVAAPLEDSNLAQLILPAIRDPPALLDVWECRVSVQPEGGVEKFASGGHKLGRSQDNLVVKMVNNAAVGAQAYVGGDFEAHRGSSRVVNILWYVLETIKWGLCLRLPAVTQLVEGIEGKRGERSGSSEDSGQSSGERGADEARKRAREENVVVLAPSKKAAKAADPQPESEGDLRLRKDAIELVVQNIPSLWGRMLDLWNLAASGSALTAPDEIRKLEGQWPDDGRLEVFCLGTKLEYAAKEVSLGRRNLLRVGQFSEMRIKFRRAEKAPNPPTSSGWLSRVLKRTRRTGTRADHRLERMTTRLMIDGEFYKLVNPDAIEFKLWRRIRITRPKEES
ncbi:uncharacterized protein VTP21DRAFT_690 [Calcarisporiella thermophila]|uniref:uncharacterized protein n=1 Tax=Calcarisporiella thermophila TaxID=911321 RepID=UPI003742D428